MRHGPSLSRARSRWTAAFSTRDCSVRRRVREAVQSSHAVEISRTAGTGQGGPRFLLRAAAPWTWIKLFVEGTGATAGGMAASGLLRDRSQGPTTRGCGSRGRRACRAGVRPSHAQGGEPGCATLRVAQNRVARMVLTKPCILLVSYYTGRRKGCSRPSAARTLSTRSAPDWHELVHALESCPESAPVAFRPPVVLAEAGPWTSARRGLGLASPE